MSRMFAVWPEAGTSARVVVPAAPESTESLAYGVDEAPIATMKLVVASVIEPFCEKLLVVQPPAEEAPPPAVMVLQKMVPAPSVWSACEPLHERMPPKESAPENLPVPLTSSVCVGALVPIPTLPAKYAVPVVVAPPKIVRPAP